MAETLLPPNATTLEQAIEQSTADRLEGIPRLTRTTANPDTIPSVWLPWLAWAWRVENWDSSWSDEQKRASIKASYSIHKKKGTFGATRAALDALGIGIKVVEWFNDTPRRAPYTFRLQVNPGNVGLKRDDWQSISDIIETTKNARSHLSSIDLKAETTSMTHQAAASCFGLKIDLPAAPTVLSNTTLHLGAVGFGVTLNIPQAHS